MRKNIKIQSYAEVGCPQWGLFEIVKKNKIEQFFIQRKEKTFGEKNVKLIMLKIVFYLKKKKQILNH